ncbi:MAG: DUF389 domain-containing protein [Desulfobacteraceae bacterium]|nr:DUF389 domain-containing protein [Desulfobacteraceae bacterium]
MKTRNNSSDGKGRKGVNLPASFSRSFIQTRKRIADSFIDLLSTSEDRKQEVRDDISIGSTPRTAYYLLLSISILIAAFGLVTNSAAVVIGAMLVSPLMTPIFGISLGLIRGDMTLLRKAFVAEFVGVIIGIGAAAILGLLPFANEVTPEMLSRTSPTLIDLMVAALAGTAGCLAMIDERISPVLPGIAMATALVPPLAVCGLCIAFGAFYGAWGAFLLFFANFLAILAISSLLFVVAGFVTQEEMGSKLAVLKRFLGPVVGLIFVTVLLTHALVGIIGERRTSQAIKDVLERDLATEQGTLIEKVIYKRKGDSIDILASVTTPRVLSPKKIKEMQNKLDKSLDLHSNLIMRCQVTKDISSTGSASGVVGRNLDGEFISTKLNPRVKRLQIAEQVLREKFEDYKGLHLDLNNLDLVELPHCAILIASIQSSRSLTPLEVERLEGAIQERLGDKQVRLLIRSDDLVDLTSKGRILYGRAHFGNLSAKDKVAREDLERNVKTEITRFKDMFATNVDAEKRGEGWSVRAEVVGPRVLRPSEVKLIEKRVSMATDKEVSLHLWCRVELMVNRNHFTSIEDFTREQVEKRLTKDKSTTKTK